MSSRRPILSRPGSGVSIRPATLDDRRAIYDWMACSDLTPSMMGPPLYPEHPVPTWEAFIADYHDGYFDPRGPDVGKSFIIECRGEAVGHVSCSPMDAPGAEPGLVELDIWMKSSAQCGHGRGEAALDLLMRRLTASPGFRGFVMRPSALNARAVRAYERAGFIALPLPREEQEQRFGPCEHRDTITMVKRIVGR
jgi:RimJ/RimL family protein N-acetyltransferase